MKSCKLIRLPSFFKKRQFSSKPNCCLIPPLGIGLITAHLRSAGIPVEQHDLNIEIHFDNHYSNSEQDRIDVDIFFDTPRIERYVDGGEDCHIDSIMEKIEARVRVCERQIVLLSLPDNIENDSNITFALAFSKFLKKQYNTLNVLGGQALWVNLLRTRYNCQNIDFIIEGDGEYPLVCLLESIMSGKELSDSKDLSICDNGKVILSNRISETKKPDFSGLPMEKYKSKDESLDYPEDIEGVMKKFQRSGILILPYRFMRGCPFECVFCVSSTQDLSYVLPPEEICRHLESLQKEHDPTGFFFMSDTININRKFINELCDRIIFNRLKMLWSDCARIDNLDRDTLFKMRKAGCIRLIFGMETASPRLLRYINKKIDLKKLEDVLKWSDEAGIWTGVEVICGFPHEEKTDIDATITFLNKNRDHINRIYLNHFDLRQNTPLYNFPVKYGLERVFKVDQFTEKDFSSFVQFGFDEANGLCWGDKVKQIESSIKMVQESCTKGQRFFTDEHLLFYLYSYFDNKDDVKSIYLKILQAGS